MLMARSFIWRRFGTDRMKLLFDEIEINFVCTQLICDCNKVASVRIQKSIYDRKSQPVSVFNSRSVITKVSL